MGANATVRKSSSSGVFKISSAPPSFACSAARWVFSLDNLQSLRLLSVTDVVDAREVDWRLRRSRRCRRTVRCLQVFRLLRRTGGSLWRHCTYFRCVDFRYQHSPRSFLGPSENTTRGSRPRQEASTLFRTSGTLTCTSTVHHHRVPGLCLTVLRN